MYIIYTYKHNHIYIYIYIYTHTHTYIFPRKKKLLFIQSTYESTQHTYMHATHTQAYIHDHDVYVHRHAYTQRDFQTCTMHAHMHTCIRHVVAYNVAQPPPMLSKKGGMHAPHVYATCNQVGLQFLFRHVEMVSCVHFPAAYHNHVCRKKNACVQKKKGP